MLNTLEKMEIPLQKLIGGAQYNLRAFRIKGKEAGPHVHIQSSVHGAEVQGNAVILKLMEYFCENDFNGSVTLIPHANPMGANTKAGTYTQGRFNSITGENWNRIYTDISKDPFFKLDEKLDSISFKRKLVQIINNITQREEERGISIEKKLGLLLQKMAAPADIVLDLHTGPTATRYLYLAQYAQKKAEAFPFPHKIIIPNEFAGAMDEATFMPWLTAKDSLDLKGSGKEESSTIPFESYTVELGSEEVINAEEALTDRDMILSLLSARGMIKKAPRDEWPESKASLLEDYKSYFAPKTGLIQYMKAPGAQVSKGEVLYRILDFSILEEAGDLKNCQTEVVARENGIVINHNPSANIHEGTMVYQLMTNFF
jgi:predicted deacylase